MIRHRRRAALVPGLLSLSALLAGCGTLELVWPYADRIVVQRVEEWTELRPEQRQRLRQRLDPWLDRIRRERLVVYARYLRAAAGRVDAGLGDEDVEWIYRHGDRLYRDLADSALEWIVPTLTGLDPAQRAELRQNVRAANAAFRQRYVAVSRREADRAFTQMLIGRVESWTGRLTPRQRELVHGGVRRLPQVHGPWYRYRLRMQAGVLAALAAEPPGPAVRAALERWWVRGAALAPAGNDRFRRSERRLLELAVRLGATLSAAQRSAAARRLRGLARQLEAIAAPDGTAIGPGRRSTPAGTVRARASS